MLIEGRHLVDGGVAQHSGVRHAAALGATTIWVLPTGYPCALSRPPGTAVGVALQALTLLIQERLITDVAAHPPGVTVKLLPPLCPLTVSAADFSQAADLVDRARRATGRWLAEGGPDLPAQERFLALHRHRSQRPPRESAAAGTERGTPAADQLSGGRLP